MLGRRGFLRSSLAAVGALLAWPAGVAWAKAKKLAVPLSKAKALETVGGSTTLKIKGREILFVRDGEASIRALDPTCTHAQCKVHYQADSKNIACKCHRSAFTLDGKVTGGPAPAPLTTYPAKLDGDRVIITVED